MEQIWFIWCTSRWECIKRTSDIWKRCSFFEDASYFNRFLKNLFKTSKTFHDASKMIDLKGRAPNGTNLVHSVYTRWEWAKSTGDIWKFCIFFEDAPYFNNLLKNLLKSFKIFHDASKMIDLKGQAPNGTYLVHLVYTTMRMSQKYRWCVKVLHFFRRCSIFQ